MQPRENKLGQSPLIELGISGDKVRELSLLLRLMVTSDLPAVASKLS